MLITKLSLTRSELKEAQDKIQTLSDRNDILDIKLQDAKVEIKKNKEENFTENKLYYGKIRNSFL